MLTVPAGSWLGLVMTSWRAALMTIVNWRVALFPASSVARTVNVEVCTVVGRPEMSPDDGAKSVRPSPAGSAPAEMDHRMEPLPPEPVTKLA